MSKRGVPRARPHLLFDASEIAALRDRSRTVMRSQRDALVAFADARLRDAPPPITGDYEKRGDTLQDPYLANLLAFSFLAVLTGETRFAEAGKRWAIALASAGDWVGKIDPRTGKCDNCGYPEGWGVTALAIAYDWLHGHLTRGERARIRDKIAAVCSGLYGATIAGEWWTGADLHHDTWIPVGGLGVGALAVLDELPKAALWAERARAVLDEALDWLDGDGAWPEGPCGWAFAMISAVPFWEAYRRRFPARAEAILANPWLRRTARYRLHARVPDGRFLAFGDCHPHGGYQQNARQAAPTLRWLAARYGDGHAQWLAAREWETRPNPYTAAWEILFMDPAVPETPPTDLPVGALFANQAMAYARTGWDPDATVVGFRAVGLLGRRANALYRPGQEERFDNSTTHTHADGNSFGVWSRGELAITMSRYGQQATSFQNSLLVDGRGQYEKFGPDHVGRPEGEVTAFFTSPAASWMVGDAARGYRPGLDRYTRRLLLIHPGLIFVDDDVRAGAPVDLEWRFHVEGDAAVTLGEAGFTSTARGRKTLLRLASPPGAQLGTLTDAYNRGVTVHRRGATTEGVLAAAIVPSLPAEATAVIEAPTPRSFVVQAMDAQVIAGFGAGRIEVPGGLDADASAAAIVVEARGTGFFAADATRLAAGGAVLMEASGPVTIAYRRADGGGHLTIAARGLTEITIDAGLHVTGVRLAAGASIPFSGCGPRITLRVPAGTVDLVLEG